MGVGPCKLNVSFAPREEGLERWEKRRLGGVEWRGTYGEEIQALEPLAWYNGHHLHFAEKGDLHWREASL
jgi:hypothetical protein